MKKLLSLFLAMALTLALAPCAFADGKNSEDGFCIKGEWYVASVSEYQRYYWPVEIEDDGTCHMLIDGEDIIFYKDGEINPDQDEHYKGKMIRQNDDVVVYYITEGTGSLEDNELLGVIIINSEDQVICYEFEAVPTLITDEKLISYNGEGSVDYQLIDNTLYFVNGEGYERGRVNTYGDDVFLCPIDSPTVTIPQETPDYEDPAYLFIRSTAIE